MSNHRPSGLPAGVDSPTRHHLRRRRDSRHLRHRHQASAPPPPTDEDTEAASGWSVAGRLRLRERGQLGGRHGQQGAAHPGPRHPEDRPPPASPPAWAPPRWAATSIDLSWTAPAMDGGSDDHRLQDRVFLRRRSKLDRPRRRHRHDRHRLLPHPPALRQHPPLPRLRHQRRTAPAPPPTPPAPPPRPTSPRPSPTRRPPST